MNFFRDAILPSATEIIANKIDELRLLWPESDIDSLNRRIQFYDLALTMRAGILRNVKDDSDSVAMRDRLTFLQDARNGTHNDLSRDAVNFSHENAAAAIKLLQDYRRAKATELLVGLEKPTQPVPTPAVDMAEINRWMAGLIPTDNAVPLHIEIITLGEDPAPVPQRKNSSPVPSHINLDTLTVLPLKDIVKPQPTTAPTGQYKSAQWMNITQQEMLFSIEKSSGKELRHFLVNVLAPAHKDVKKALQQGIGEYDSVKDHEIFLGNCMNAAMDKIAAERGVKLTANTASTTPAHDISVADAAVISESVTPEPSPFKKAASSFFGHIKTFVAKKSEEISDVVVASGRLLSGAIKFLARPVVITSGSIAAVAFAAAAIIPAHTTDGISTATAQSLGQQFQAAADMKTEAKITPAPAFKHAAINDNATGQTQFDTLTAKLAADAPYVDTPVKTAEPKRVKISFHSAAEPHTKPPIKVSFDTANIGGHVDNMKPLDIATMTSDLATIKRACTYVLGNGVDSEFCRSIN